MKIIVGTLTRESFKFFSLFKTVIGFHIQFRKGITSVPKYYVLYFQAKIFQARFS